MRASLFHCETAFFRRINLTKQHESIYCICFCISQRHTHSLSIRPSVLWLSLSEERTREEIEGTEGTAMAGWSEAWRISVSLKQLRSSSQERNSLGSDFPLDRRRAPAQHLRFRSAEPEHRWGTTGSGPPNSHREFL